MQIPGISGSPYPKELRDELNGYAEEFGALRGVHSARLGRYEEYRAELTMSRQRETERQRTLEDYGQLAPEPNTPRRHAIALPFGQALTVKNAHRIAGRMPDVIVDRREESAFERYRSNTMEALVWSIIRASNGQMQFASAAWDASQLGSCVFDLYFDPKSQHPIFREIDPASFLDVPGALDPHDFDRAYRFWEVPAVSLRNEYRGKEFRGMPIPTDKISPAPERGDRELGQNVVVVQMCNKERAIRFALCKDGPIGLYEQEHGFGLTPYFVIPNLGPERAIWGWSDYEFVRDLSKYIPKLFSRQADLIRQVANGAYTERGTGMTGPKLVALLRGGGIIPLKRDGAIEPVEVPQVPAFADGHATQAIEFLKMLGFSPAADWGESAATSGSDRSLQLAPAFQLSGLKQINWSAGLARLFAGAFKVLEAKQEKDVYVRGVKQQASSRKTERFAFKFPTPKEDAAEMGVAGLPETMEELFGGDYSVGFEWQNKVDPEDPAYVASELNKFQQGAQSLETTLENLGCKAPEDEMMRIEQEADRFPWIRQGQIAMFKAQQQNAGQGEGGGAPFGPGDLSGAVDTMTSPDGAALDADALSGSLPFGGGVGTPYGAA
jgi:hypothetical protein